jgi:hypothetical protein
MTTIGQKANYVRRAPQSEKHHCHWPGCDKQVPPAMWGCRAHWYALPLQLRNRIWATFKPGQEISKTPSREYVAVAREVRDWITANGGAAP